MRGDAKGKNQPFPLVEAFGFAADSPTDEAQRHFQDRWCPFASNPCEKFRQYRFGYCSVTYAAADDRRTQYTYAVCDHRVDGAPVREALLDYFGHDDVHLAPEVVIADPRTSFDYVAVSKREPSQAIAIETQAIDIRGGGVGPAWDAWMRDDTANWRHYFTKEAELKGRKDSVSYGVNMANIYKRLGLQVATKGAYLKAIGVPLYVVMQDRPFQYLYRRVRFRPLEENAPWDICFLTFDYTGEVLPNGQMEFVRARILRTTCEEYSRALSADHRAQADQREAFLEKARIKAIQVATVADANPSGARKVLGVGT